MDIGSAFTYMFDDSEWIKKLAIGGALVMVGSLLSSVLVGILVLLPVLGYIIVTLRNVRDGAPTPLPEWTDFGGLFKTGLMVFLISLVYSIPLLLIFCCIFGAIQAMAYMGDPDASQIMGVVVMCSYCLVFVIMLLVNIVMPAAIIRYAQYDTFASAFQFGELMTFIKTNIGDYIIVILLSIVAGMVANFGFILCCIGLFFTAFWAALVNANLFGQLARKAQLQGTL